MEVGTAWWSAAGVWVLDSRKTLMKLLPVPLCLQIDTAASEANVHDQAGSSMAYVSEVLVPA